MSTDQTEVVIPEITQRALSAFSEPQKALAECRAFMALSVAKDGITKVTASRVSVKKLRVSIDKRRKEQNQAALDHQRAVNSFAQKLIADVSEIEDYLAAQEDAYEAEKRAKLEAIEAEKTRRLMDRVRRLEAAGVDSSDVENIRTMTDVQFDLHLQAESAIAAEHREKEEAERIAREEQEAAERLEAETRLKAEQAEHARLNALQAEENRKAAEELRLREAELIAERQRLAQEQAELLRQQEEARRIEEERKTAERHAEEESRVKEAEEAERIRREAVAPDIEKAKLFRERMQRESDIVLIDLDVDWDQFARNEMEACYDRIEAYVFWFVRGAR